MTYPVERKNVALTDYPPYQEELMRRYTRRVTRKRALQVAALLGSLAFILLVVWGIGSTLNTPEAATPEPFADTLAVEDVRKWCESCNHGQFSKVGNYILYKSPASEEATLHLPQGNRKAVVVYVYFMGEAPNGITARTSGYLAACQSGTMNLPTQEMAVPDPQVRALNMTFIRKVYFTIVDVNPRTGQCKEPSILPE